MNINQNQREIKYMTRESEPERDGESNKERLNVFNEITYSKNRLSSSINKTCRARLIHIIGLLFSVPQFCDCNIKQHVTEHTRSTDVESN